jgi:hypothetical protein
MLSRRKFLGWASGCLSALSLGRLGYSSPTEALPDSGKGRPEESVQQLIDQIRELEGQPGSGAHMRAIEDQVRVRLFLAGSLACKYRDPSGRNHLCVLCTKTGGLFTTPLRMAGTPGPRRELEAMGLGHVVGGIRDVPWATSI